MGAGLRPAAHNAAQQRAPPHDVESSAGGGAASPASSDSEKPPRRSDGTSRPRSLGLLAALLYGGTAVAMGFINKAALRTLPELAMLTLQQALTAASLSFARTFGLLPAVRAVSALHRAELLTLLPIVLLYQANVVFALAGLSALSVPVYNVVKRTTPVLVLAYHAAHGRAPSRTTSATVLVTVGGCVVAGYGDLDWNLAGYANALTSCALQAAYLLLVERTSATGRFSSTELLYFNAVLSLPPLALLAATSGQAHQAAPALGAMLRGADPWGLAVLALCLPLGMLLNFALFLCTTTNSALTTTIVGVLKGVASTTLGFVLLGGAHLTGAGVAGVVLNTAGGVAYTAVKYRERHG